MRQARERGAATLEQLGTIVIVVLLFVAAVLAFSTYGPRLEQALCQLGTSLGISAGACDGAAPPAAEEGPTDEDFLPPVCSLRETGSQHSSEFSIGFFTFGDEAGFVVQENADGTVEVTVTDGGALGAEVGAGAQIGGKDSGIGADVSLGGGLTFGVGDTWKFDGIEDWHAMEDRLNEYLAQQESLKHDTGGGYALWLWLSDGYVDRPQDPAVTSVTVGLEFDANADIGLRSEHGRHREGGPRVVKPNVGLYAEGSLANEVVITTDHETGEYSETFQFTANGGAGANMLILDAGATGEVVGAYKVTRDAEDRIVSVEFMTETSGGADVAMGYEVNGNGGGLTGTGTDRTITTTTLDVTDDNRDIVEGWITENNARGASGQPALLPPNAVNPSVPFPGDDFAQLLYQQATTSERVYSNVTDGWSFGVEFALGLKFGASLSAEESEVTLENAQFLGAPLQDGVRPMIPDATCEA